MASQFLSCCAYSFSEGLRSLSSCNGVKEERSLEAPILLRLARHCGKDGTRSSWRTNRNTITGRITGLRYVWPRTTLLRMSKRWYCGKNGNGGNEL
jgi:hypothetical protein